jgi:uncharacterized integral membrane protein
MLSDPCTPLDARGAESAVRERAGTRLHWPYRRPLDPPPESRALLCPEVAECTSEEDAELSTPSEEHGMKIWIRLAVGVLLLFFGVVWSLQGSDVIGGSGMSGQAQWLVIGLFVAVIGAVLLVGGVRKLRAGERV